MKRWAWLLALPLAAGIALALAQVSRAAPDAPALTFPVNTTVDESDDNTADNVCHTATNHCALRAAVQQANNTNGVVIVVPPGTYILTDTVRGDLSLNNSMVISGAGSAATIIQGNPAGWNSRIVHVSGGNDVTIKGVTVENGNVGGDGGGISNAGFLTLSDSIVYSNTAFGSGGGIFNHRASGTARLVLANSSVIANRTTYTFTLGAGIYNGDVLTVSNSLILSNTTGTTYGNGGGLSVDAGGSAYVTRTLISGNSAFLGGGLSVASGGALDAVHSTISANRGITGTGGGIDNAGLLSLNSVTMTNNYAASGGGIANHDGGKTVMVLGLVMSNSAINGAGVYNYNSGTMILGAVSIQRNVATNAGGGIFNESPSALTLLVGDVSENSSPGTGVGGTGNGAGLYTDGGPALINGTTLRANTAFGGGGGILGYNGNLTLTAAIVISNSANTGGGVSTDGNAIIDQSLISGNNAIEGAGILANGPFANQLNISNTTISGNIAGFNGGGGIFAAGLHLVLENDTLSDNRSQIDGGGIYNAGAFWRLNNVTIAGNVADSDVNGSGDGGGVFNDFHNSNVTFFNTLIGANVDSGGQAPDCAGALYSADYNLIQSTLGCILTGPLTHNITGANPQLGPLQNNGGPTPTRALLPNSPAINAGSPEPQNGNFPCAPRDQRGVVRPAGGRCDIGAYESPFRLDFLPSIMR